MKIHHPLSQRLAVGSLCVLVAGCLFRPANVTTRQFVLKPALATSPSRDRSTLAVGLGAIKFPDYLLRSSMTVRKGDHEIEYLENSLWAERLDRSFQRTLAANLMSLLPGSRIQQSAWQSSEVTLAAFVNVERLDVDAQGNGTLVAHWQIETPDRRQVLKSGECNLNKSGPPPFANPEALVVTLSDLTAQFSEALAQAIRDCASSGAGAH